MGRRPRKRRRRHVGVAAGEGPDRFSHLAEDLLRSVINCLPTRTAVKLAGVSRHFRREVFRLVERVDLLKLHEPHFPVPLGTTPPRLVRRLALAPHRAIPPAMFRPIIDEAAAYGLSELSARLTRRARLPRNVLSVRSLAVLALHTCAVPPWSDVSLPCLRTLKLHRVAIHQENISKILASATRLDTLEMEYCTGHGTGKGGGCTVESSSVRNLKFRPTLKQEATVIRAPGLRVLTLYTRSRAKSLELAPAPEIRKVYLHISKSKSMVKESFRLRPFLDAAVKLESLTLRGHATKVLSYEYENNPKLMVMYKDLRILSVSLDLSSEQEPVFLLKILESCPNLLTFILSAAKEGNDSNLPRFTDHKDRLAAIPCLTTSLVQFKFLGFKPQEYHKELIVYLLTVATQLKKVGVEFDKSQLAAVKQILSVRTAQTERTSTKYEKNYFMELEYS